MKKGNYTRPGQALQRHKISVYSKMMNPSDLLEQIQQRSPHLPASLLQDFLAQMDPDYFEQFPLETILQHLELTHQLTFESPCAVAIHTRSSRQYQIHLVAYDYF
ncbi:MAG: hypothetical protein ACQ9IQ_13160, partial [Nitrospirales bacterium]